MSLSAPNAQRGAIRSRHAAVCRLIAPLCAAALIGFASSAALARCSASAVQENLLTPSKRIVAGAQRPVRSERDVPTWKTIAIGTFANPLELRNRLDELGCGVGGQAGEILARPAFVVASRKAETELVVVTPAQLGFTSDTVRLADLYARARQVGIALARPEIGPQLRMQYVDQPIGEFLAIGMEPIKTWNGEPVILNVANGGAGLILIGQDGRPEAEVPVRSRFVFERSHTSAPDVEPVGQTTATLRP